MSKVLLFRRRNSGAAGAPASLKSGEPAYSAVDNILYIGKGDDGSGNALAVEVIGGRGFFAPLASPALSGAPTAPTPAPGDSSGLISNTAFVMAAVQVAQAGLDPKASVRAATTANITLSGLQTLDTAVTLVDGDRVLVKDQTAPEQNGFYNAHSGAWTRSSDAALAANLTMGAHCFVEEGTVNGGHGYVLITPEPIVVGTAPLTFTSFSGGVEMLAGVGITKTGLTLSVTGLAAATAGGLLKRSGDGVATASADTDYSTPSTTIDGGTF